MFSKWITGAISSLALGALSAGGAFAQDTVKIGLIVPMTGEQASTGKQIKAGVDLYMKEHGDTVAGKKIQVILRDSGSVPDNTKRLAQELIVNDKVNVIAGFEITPAALVVAPLATEARWWKSSWRRAPRSSPSVALHRAHQRYRAAVVRHHRRLGGEERHQEGRHHRLRLCAGLRRGEIVH